MKYLVLLENKKKVRDAEVIFNFSNIKYEQIWPDRFNVYCTRDKATELNNRFEWMVLICTE